MQNAQSALAAAQATAPDYGSAISSMQAQLSQIQQSSDLPAPVVSPVSSSAALPDVKTRYTKSITLDRSLTALSTANKSDLDDDGSGKDGVYDIAYIDGYTLALNGGAQAQMLDAGAPGTPDYPSCKAATFADAGIDLSYAKKGAVICVRTNENRIAALQLAADPDSDKAVFTSTTYDPPLG